MQTNTAIQEVERMIPPVVEAANALTVTDSIQYQDACTFLQQVAVKKKQVDEVFDPIVKAAHAAHKEAVAQKKKFTDPLADAESVVKRKISTYRAEEDRKAREEEARLNEARRKQAEEEALAAAILEPDEEEQDVIIERAIAQPPAPVYVAPKVPVVSGISERKVWKYRIVNAALIPREYLVPNEVAIGAHVRSMKENANIPGVEIYSESSTSVRV
jgi:hypothetical protein